MPTFVYVLIGSGVAILLAIVLYFSGRGGKLRIPAVVVGTIGGLAAGVVLGAGLQIVYEEASKTPENGSQSFSLLNLGSARAEPKAPAPGPQAKRAAGGANPAGGPQAGVGAGGGGGGGGGMGGMMGMMGGGGGSNSKNQLVALVTKLDQLTGRPLELRLSDDQKATVRDELQGLDEVSILGEEQAKARFDALLKSLENQRDTLEAAGYRWPGGGRRAGAGGQATPDVPNPFREDGPGKHLQSLKDKLNKPA